MTEKDNVTKCFFLDVVVFSLEDSFALYMTTILTCVINGIFSIVATIGNAVILTVIFRTTALQTCSNLFLGNLVVADLLVGMMVQPLYIVYKASEANGSYSCVGHMLFSTSAWLCAGVSFLSLTSLNCERYIAIFSPLSYPSIVNRKRVLLVSLFIWMVSFLVVSSRFMGLGNTNFNVICTLIIVLSLAIMAFISGRIYRLVRYHHRQISHSSAEQRMGAEGRARETKLGRNVLWLTGIYFLCYLPTLCIMVAYVSLSYSVYIKTIYSWTDTIVLVNSSLNPGIYCWRNRSMKMAVMKFINSRKNPQPTVLPLVHLSRKRSRLGRT